MNLKARQRYDMLVRVREFGANHAGLFRPGEAGLATFGIVTQCVQDVMNHAIAEQSGRSGCLGATSSKMAARRVLREHLAAIVRTARALALDRPGFDEQFRMPRGTGDRRLLRVSRSVAQRARKQARRFISLGMPSTFLDDLSRDINAFEEALCHCRETRRQQIAVSAAIAASLADGFLAARRLDAVVPNTLGANPAAIAAWRKARRVSRTRRAPRRDVGSSKNGAAATTPEREVTTGVL